MYKITRGLNMEKFWQFYPLQSCVPEVTFLDVFKYIYQEHIHTSTGKCQTMFTSRFHNVETIKQHLVLFYNPTVFHKMLAIWFSLSQLL